MEERRNLSAELNFSAANSNRSETAALKFSSADRFRLSSIDKNNQKEKIMVQLGTVKSQLLNMRFEKIGSLFEKGGEYHIGECLSPALLWHQRDSLGDDVARGPYQHNSNFYESLPSAFLLHIKELPLSHHTFFAPIPKIQDFKDLHAYRSAISRWNDFVELGSKIDYSNNKLAYCIAGHFMQKSIPTIDRESSALFGNGFPIGHPDLSMSNIFVDNDFNITCVIDWAFSSTVPISTLLMTPSLPHPRDEIDTTLVPKFQASFTHQFLHGNDTILVAKFWESTYRAWLFTRLVTLDGMHDYYYFTKLFALVYQTNNNIDIPKLFKVAQEGTDFVELARTLSKDDRSATKIKRDEEAYFCSSDPRREAVARKLTMIADLSTSFVADTRLWRIIEEATAIKL